MRTAISLPDDLFEEIEQLVRRSRRPRSEVYAEALREYLASRTREDEVTAAMNTALAEIGDEPENDQFVRAAAHRTLSRVEW